MKKSLALLLSISSLSLFSQFSHENVSTFSNWENVRILLFDYDENENKITSELKSWDVESENWSQKKIDRINYDDKGEVIFSSLELFEGSQYQLKSTIESEIRINDIGEEKTTFFVDEEKGIKVRGTKEYVNKLENGDRQTETLKYNRNNGDWEELALVEERFDSEGNLLASISKKWDTKLADWVNFKRMSVSINASETEKEVVSEFWDRQNNNWSKKKTKGFTSWNNQKTAVTHQTNSEWNLQTKTWYATTKCTIFPIGKNKEFSEGLRLNIKTNKWEKTSRVFYYYDDLGRIEEVVYQLWDLDTNDYLNTSRTLYKRDKRGLIIQEIYQKALPLELNYEFTGNKCEFANPYLIGGNIKCNFIDESEETTIQVIDTKGSIVHLGKIGSSKFSIDKNLPSGSYFLVVSNGDKIVNQEKLLIQQD